MINSPIWIVKLSRKTHTVYVYIFEYVFTVNSIDCEMMPMTEKNLEDLEQCGPRPILPYSSMFIFGQTNPWVVFTSMSPNFFASISKVNFSITMNQQLLLFVHSLNMMPAFLKIAFSLSPKPEMALFWSGILKFRLKKRYWSWVIEL